MFVSNDFCFLSKLNDLNYASIFYTTNSTFHNVGGFDPDKPTVVILHPLFLDSTWLGLQFGDPRLTRPYNLIAFDMRSCGQSSCSLNARHDSWVDAADLALCFQRLHLPPSHILALEAISVNCALRFAVLFPEMCLSLTLVNVPSPTESPRSTLEELIHSCSFAPDLESFEHAAQAHIRFLFGEDCESDMQDELISFWATRFPPRLRPRLAETVSVLVNRTPLRPEIYASIKQPVLLIHGDKNEMFPITNAEQLSSQLTGVKDGAILYSVKGKVWCNRRLSSNSFLIKLGGSSMLSVIPGNASIANKVVSNFWSRLPHHGSHIIPPQTPVEERMSKALETLTALTGCESKGSHKPLCSLSFSCLCHDVIKVQSELLEYFKQDSHSAFSPLSVFGRPMRKFSERETEHWFSAEYEGLSIANSPFLSSRRASQSLEKKTSRPDLSIPRSPRDILPTVSTTTELIAIKGSPKMHGNFSAYQHSDSLKKYKDISLHDIKSFPPVGHRASRLPPRLETQIKFCKP